MGTVRAAGALRPTTSLCLRLAEQLFTPPELGMLQKTTTLAVSVSIVARALGAVPPIGAQVAGATLSGSITHQQGGALGGAKVVVKDVATDVSVETSTNTDGAYTVPNLRPADYEVTASATGFSTAVSKVMLTMGAKQTMDLRLT